MGKVYNISNSTQDTARLLTDYSTLSLTSHNSLISSTLINHYLPQITVKYIVRLSVFLKVIATHI